MQTAGIYGTMLQDYYGTRLDDVMAARRERFARIRTAKAAREYAAEVKQRARKVLGAMPKRTPLNRVIVGTEVVAGIAVDRIIFESRPNYPVTANFYRPEQCKGKLPAVLGMIGHEPNGILWKNDQAFAMNLAAKGFAVLMADPAGQGERGQFRPLIPVGSQVWTGCTEHNFCNKLLLAQGDCFGRWRIWDGMRALDYLLSRPEVDAGHVGVTGCSGGGTMTTYMWAFDDRFTMAAPSCYITSFMRNYDNELPVDAEQVIPGLAATGFEMADFLIARAPEPVIILAQDNDFFDPRGTMETFDEVSRIYRLLGHEENARIAFNEGVHGYPQEAREQMYGFFTEYALGARSPREAVVTIPGNTVQVTPTGHTLDLPGMQTLPEIAAQKLDKLQNAPKFGDPAAIRRYLETVQHVHAPENAPAFQVLRTQYLPDERMISRFGIHTEPGIRGFLHILSADAYNRIPAVEELTLYAAADDSVTELLDGRAVGTGLVAALDVRGVGASRPTTTDRVDYDIRAPYAAEYFYDAAGLMLNDPMPGGRARDVLAAMMLLKMSGVKKLHLAGRGIGALAAAMAAAVEPDLCDTVTLYNAPLSYAGMCRRGRFLWPQSAVLRDFLKVGDLAYLYAMLKEKNIELVEPWGDDLTPMPEAQVKADLQ